MIFSIRNNKFASDNNTNLKSNNNNSDLSTKKQKFVKSTVTINTETLGNNNLLQQEYINLSKEQSDLIFEIQTCDDCKKLRNEILTKLEQEYHELREKENLEFKRQICNPLITAVDIYTGSKNLAKTYNKVLSCDWSITCEKHKITALKINNLQKRMDDLKGIK